MWKAQLGIKISRLIQSKGWTQAQAAERVGLDQPKVSQLMRGGLSGFSADRLFAILNRLGYSVEVLISTKEQSPEKTHTRVMIASRDVLWPIHYSRRLLELLVSYHRDRHYLNA